MRYFFIASLTLTLSACSLFNSSTENEIGLSEKQLKKVAIIGDVGNKDGSLFSKDIHSNSFESIAMALKASNGVQIDIQISKDSTLWLFGEEKIRDCKYQIFKSLSEYNDEQIEFASTCWYEKQLIPLDSFIYIMDSLAFKNKIISLDLQSISDPVAIERFGGEEKLAEIMAQKLDAFNQLKRLTFLAELPTVKAIQAFEKYSDFSPYLRISEQSKIEEYPRLSIPTKGLNVLNQKEIESFQLWGANSANQLLEGMESGAQIIQTNNLKMAEFVQNRANLDSKLLAKDSLNNKSDTLFSLRLSENQLKEDFLLQLTVSEGANLTGATFYIQGFNEEGHEVLWKGTALQNEKTNNWIFINAEELIEKDCKQILVYIWGQNSPENNAVEFQMRQFVH